MSPAMIFLEIVTFKFPLIGEGTIGPKKSAPNINCKTSPEAYHPPPSKTTTDETAPALSVVISKEANFLLAGI